MAQFFQAIMSVYLFFDLKIDENCCVGFKITLVEIDTLICTRLYQSEDHWPERT